MQLEDIYENDSSAIGKEEARCVLALECDGWYHYNIDARLSRP